MSHDELIRRMNANGVTNGIELAAKVGVSQPTASRWINNKVTIGIGMAALIRQHLPKLPRK